MNENEKRNEISEILQKQEETLSLVQKLWRAEKWRRFWIIFRYVIYAGIILGAFYFLTPYAEQAANFIQQFKNDKNQESQNILR